MSTQDLETRVQNMAEQLDLQAEAITKLVELISSFDGVEAGAMNSYALRLKRVHGGPAAPSGDAAPVAPVAPKALPASVDELGESGRLTEASR